MIKEFWDKVYHTQWADLFNDAMQLFLIFGFVSLIWHRLLESTVKDGYHLSQHLVLSMVFTFIFFYRTLPYHIQKVEYFTHKKSTGVKDRLEMATIEIIKQQDTVNSTLRALMHMIDANSSVLMWIKDVEDRYVYADQTLREKVLRNCSLPDAIGKNDIELATGIENHIIDLDRELAGITPEVLPNIADLLGEHDSRLCQLTDVITRIFDHPCRFYEHINGRLFAVWKSPVRDGEIVVGTVGSMMDVTPKKACVMRRIQQLIKTGDAYRIDATNSYYIARYSFEPII